MAYFSNETEGLCFDDQCAKCKYGEDPCPIAALQHEYNYEAVGNEIATKILNSLVKNDGNCEMFKAFKNDFEID